MRLKIILLIPLFCLAIASTSCESEAERKERLAKEEQQRIELEENRKAEEAERAFQLEQERIATEARLEKERQEKVIYDKYINNSLSTGTATYAYCFGQDNNCVSSGCSQIKVKTPFNSDVMVIIKKQNKVYRHAYVRAASQFTFEIPNGTYQTFFYYGKGWYPEKEMKETDCGILKGGFVANEIFSKDDPQSVNNEVLTYELILQENGNLETEPSDLNEAL
ncbi:hypothetical protein OE09_1195 [Flavobacteriaceae bacterium MAR_2010_72]|nr:hypothetical protein OE09_1195 [Flavobacteriaceae bacterium MAR_2010_72]